MKKQFFTSLAIITGGNGQTFTLRYLARRSIRALELMGLRMKQDKKSTLILKKYLAIEPRNQATKTKANNMKKDQMLTHWRGLDPNQKLKPAPVPYKHTGTTYAQDGLRITGSPQWIDAVLSRLQDLLEFENGQTRLQVVYKESRDRETGADLESSNCYVQVHERGGQAIMCNARLAATK